MLQSFKYLLPFLLFASSAFGQALPIRNDTPSNLRDLGANLNVGRNFAVDQKGQIKIGAITPGTGATDLGKAEDTSYADSETGVSVFAKRLDTASAEAGNGDHIALIVDGNGTLWVAGSQVEDAVAVSGDRLMAIGGVINTSSNQPASNGDYTVPSLGSYGENLETLFFDDALGDSRQAVKREDSAYVTTSAGVFSLGILQDPLTADAVSNDYGPTKYDLAGRTIVTYAPVGEAWNACSGTSTGTSDTAIKAAVASNRIYTTDITCTNFSTVASRVNIKDGASTIYSAGINGAAASLFNWDHSFFVPLRGSVNTALNFAMVTTSTSTICCATGYISTV